MAAAPAELLDGSPVIINSFYKPNAERIFSTSSTVQSHLAAIWALSVSPAFTVRKMAALRLMQDWAGMDKFLAEHEEYKRLDIETAWTIDVVMGVKKFMGNEERYKTEEGYDMCQAIREMWEDGVNVGISQGISQGIRNLMTNLNLTCDQAMDALGIAVQEEREKYRHLGEKE